MPSIEKKVEKGIKILETINLMEKVINSMLMSFMQWREDKVWDLGHAAHGLSAQVRLLHLDQQVLGVTL